MKLVFLLGDSAVGKMTVGQALMRRTGLRLFHNHMTIEPVLEIFGTFNGSAVQRMRDVIFEEFARSEQYGMIFTFMFAFDMPSDWQALEHIKDIFRPYGTEFYYVELFAPLEVRLARNRTENRLQHKPSKRNVAFSEQLTLQDDENHRLVSYDGEWPFDNYLKLENSTLSPDEAAQIIQEHFGL